MRMLSVKCSNQFPCIEIGKRNNLDFSKAELPLCDGPDCPQLYEENILPSRHVP
jgi:hypothetical protein